MILFPGVQSARAGTDVDLLSFGVGYYDISDDEGAADFRVEYRSGTPLIWDIKPWLGVEVTSDGAAYGVGGLLLDWEVAEDIYIVPAVREFINRHSDE